jgi:hypothetical protein
VVLDVAVFSGGFPVVTLSGVIGAAAAVVAAAGGGRSIILLCARQCIWRRIMARQSLSRIDGGGADKHLEPEARRCSAQPLATRRR